MNEVVVTGLGVIMGEVVSPLSLFNTLKSGQSQIRIHPEFNALGFTNPAMCYLDQNQRQWLQQQVGKDVHGLHSQMALYAATQAWQQASPGKITARGGVMVASNKQSFDEQHLAGIAAHYDTTLDQFDLDSYLLQPTTTNHSLFNFHQDLPSQLLAGRYGLQAIPLTHGDACAAGSMAIGSAFRRIRAGEADLILVGASECMAGFSPLVAFSAVGALSVAENFQGAAISRPFDEEREGFIMGEGAAFLVLESAQHAARRKAAPLARIRGFAAQLEACRITASNEDGSEYARCMQACLDDAGLTIDAVDHINAHGTSTQMNDAVEARAIQTLFGSRSKHIPVTANKSALGHSLATSGAVEALLSILTLQQQCLLPTLNFRQGDAVTSTLNIVTTARPYSCRHILSNSFGFGGENCSLLLEAV